MIKQLGMLSDKRKLSLFTIILVLLVVGYYSGIRPLIPSIYKGTAPSVILKIVDNLYPRFIVEKHRFDVNFFADKADQFIFRLVLVAILAYLLKKILDKKELFSAYLTANTSVRQTHISCFVFYGLVLFFTYDWLSILNTYQKLTVFYEPVSLIAWLHLPYPSAFWLLLMWSLYIISLLLCIFNIFSFISAGVGFVLFILLQGYLHSFGKINHEYAPLTYLMGIMPFWLYESRGQSGYYKSWALQLLRVATISGYVLAGLEKLLISKGFVWQSEGFGGIFSERYPDFFEPISLGVLSAMVIIFQISFVFVPFSVKAQKILLPLGVMFHISTWYFLGIGDMLHPWLIGYLFYFEEKQLNHL